MNVPGLCYEPCYPARSMAYPRLTDRAFILKERAPDTLSSLS
jgi:hypothetical protein